MMISLSTFWSPYDEIQGLCFDPLIVRARLEEVFPGIRIESEDHFVDMAELARSKLEPEAGEHISERMLTYSKERGPAITFIIPFEEQEIRGTVNRHQISFRCEGTMVEKIKGRLINFLQTFRLAEIDIYNV